MSNSSEEDDSALFPPLPGEMDAMREAMAEEAPTADLYSFIVESQCGTEDDSQPVEQYDGTLGVTKAFVDAHQAKIGQLQWNDNLDAVYDNPGNVSGVRWCTGTLISENLFLSAGHCFDQTAKNWQLPKVNGTSDTISPAEIATNMHVNFNYQVDPAGNPRAVVELAIVNLVEYRLGGLDYAIVRLAGSPGQQFGEGQPALADAQTNDMLAIIGHPLGLRKRVEAGPLSSFDGDYLRYNDIDTLGGNSGSAIWRSSSGLIVGVHTEGGCTGGDPEGGSNRGVRISRISQQSPILQSLLMPAPLQGTFTVRQKSTGRFVDAHQSSAQDFRVVTRTAQNDDTQRWAFTLRGDVYTVQQVSNNRFVDAYEDSSQDFRLVTRNAKGSDAQRWVFLPVSGKPDTYTIQQLSSGRFVDAHLSSSQDFRLVTRTAQNDDTQRWLVQSVPNRSGTYTLKQVSSGRFVDAHEHSGEDFRVVTRPVQLNDTQRWALTCVGRVYTVQQVSTSRHWDAHEHSGEDFRVVTRAAQHNDTQRWVLLYRGSDDTYTIQQLSSGRFVDAYEDGGNDFRLVTRDAKNSDAQRWMIDAA
jgi:V8-like Glu-specific endopeptidase